MGAILKHFFESFILFEDINHLQTIVSMIIFLGYVFFYSSGPPTLYLQKKCLQRVGMLEYPMCKRALFFLLFQVFPMLWLWRWWNGSHRFWLSCCSRSSQKHANENENRWQSVLRAKIVRCSRRNGACDSLLWVCASLKLRTILDWTLINLSCSSFSNSIFNPLPIWPIRIRWRRSWIQRL